MQRSPEPSTTDSEVDMFALGEVIDNKFTVKKKLGRGGYGNSLFRQVLTDTV